jgi:enamine deaminase RidA (YjgF/YER057c/UK114 family)
MESPEHMTPTETNTLAQWEAQLPSAPAPLGIYIPCQVVGTMAYTSGTLPMKDGALAYSGKVGEDLSLEQAQEAARLCILNALASLKAQLGSLARIAQVVKVVGFVNSPPHFTQQPAVLNAASTLLGEVFGPQVGQHVRSAVGVAALPLNAPVEIELIVALHP